MKHINKLCIDFNYFKKKKSKKIIETELKIYWIKSMDSIHKSIY